MNFKFGVLYAKVGQTSDDEMFSNGKSTGWCLHTLGYTCFQYTQYYVCTYTHSHTEKPSSAFEEFVDLLGDEVRLEGWKQFRGGLDNKSKSKHPNTRHPPSSVCVKDKYRM